MTEIEDARRAYMLRMQRDMTNLLGTAEGRGLRGWAGEEAYAAATRQHGPPSWRERIAAAWACLRGDA